MLLAPDDLKVILEAALEGGGDFAEVFLERRQTTVIGCEDNKIERVHSGLDQGAGIRVLKGEDTVYGYTNELTRDGLLELARKLGRAAGGKGNNKPEIEWQRPKPNWDFQVKKRPDEIPVEEKVALVQRANEAARAVDQRIVQVSVSYGDIIQEVTIANSEGILVEDERVRCRFVVNAVASDGKIIQTGYESIGGLIGFELFEENDPVELARKAAERAVRMLEARPAPAGRMTVVMAGEAGGTMIHEACGHGLEADLVQKKLSVYAGKKGQQVASPLITVIDDATLPGKYGSFRFDDEGQPGQRTVLIKDGILVDYMYDYLTARKEGRRSTGNGRRESYRDRPIPRMTNTFIAPGKDDPQAIIRETKKGLLVKRMGGGQVNTTNGDFVFDVAEGYLIENGEIGPLVRGATLTGNGPEVLKMVDRVGSDLGFSLGTCGKDGQGVPVGDAQPTIRIPEMVVGGILDEEENP
ncbi:MAG: TldD/PmbA family protein [Thermanaeromonas sp.]|uniref:TldD/PmbA family protein n=1 Tax=Thermanaeromonas sp. TaxID=2003697 RepID=UPI002437D465|nr:TldD/PmbA family protein [Thermanaeromonas sp.]MCG0277599.1 TldD/PmbA family protein [Thermanaeromonas sp.]